MPSSLQTAVMMFYASWCCLSSVQAATKHTSSLQQLPTEPLTLLCWITAAFVTAYLLSLKRRWLEERAAARSIGGLPFDTSDVAHVSPTPVSPELVTAPFASPIVAPAAMPVAAEEPQPKLSRKERRRSYNAERLRREKEEKLRKERERLFRHGAPPSIAYGPQPPIWYQHAPGTVLPESVPLAMHNYYAPLSQPPIQTARPVSMLGSRAYSAAPSTPYSESKSDYAHWGGFSTPVTQGSQYQMPQLPYGPYLSIPQWSANVPGLTRSPSSEYAPSGAHTPAVSYGSAPQYHILDDSHIEDFHLPPKYALDDVRSGAGVASDLKVDEIDLVAGVGVGDYVTAPAPANADADDREPSVSVPKVADLSWVAEQEWHRPVLKRVARVQTAPVEHVCDEA